MINAVVQAADEIDAGNKENVLDLVRKAQMVGEDLLDVGILYTDSQDLRAGWYAPSGTAKEAGTYGDYTRRLGDGRGNG